ncbi:MAG TPA: hypothetical protein VHU83_03805 [Bryobacteraceae bacterium]|jgi:hypothetical protein|nr:hypothetical protein [Bryobacteraceae bacterium]
MSGVVNGELENGRVLLTVTYGPDQMAQSGPASRLRREMIAAYDKAAGADTEVRDCIVLMQAQAAGSPFVRGLFDLWEHVRTRKGRLICANYPPEYIDSLLTVGLQELEGFSLATSKEDAVSQLKRPSVKKQRR